MADLDLTEFLKDGSGSGPANLDWLDVDEVQYRKQDQLPKQNLDIVPDLKALWQHDGSPSTAFVPNTGAPKTMVDLGPSGPVRGQAEDILRTARLALYQSDDPRKLQHALVNRFDGSALAQARTALASVLAERGLLGRFYVDASDFPGCASGSKQASEFVRRFAAQAQFVKAKSECRACIHRTAYAEGMGHCSVFHKQIEVEVPYTEALAESVEQNQRARGKAVQASTLAPRERVQAAYLADQTGQGEKFTGRHQQPPRQVQSALTTDQKLIAVSSLTRKRDEEAAVKLSALKARPIVATLRREMLKGRSFEELLTAIRLSHDVRDLRETRSEWEPIFREAGLYGTVFTTQDSFDDCRVGADFLSKHGSKTKAVVAGEKCGSCIFNKAGRCMMYGKKLVQTASEILTQETVDQVIWEEKLAGNLPSNSEKISWGPTPREALRSIYAAALGPKPTLVHTSLRQAVEQGFYGQSVPQRTGDLTKREILKTAAQYMNEGLYGSELIGTLKLRFEVRDLLACKTELAGVITEQGLQGIKYVDPSVYDDYGHGCREAARKHRSRKAVQYAKIGSKCGSCVHHTSPGYCSVLDKALVIEPPYIDKRAEQQAILASKSATTVEFADLQNNGLTMMAEYQLQHGDGAISLNPVEAYTETVIEFGPHDVKL